MLAFKNERVGPPRDRIVSQSDMQLLAGLPLLLEEKTEAVKLPANQPKLRQLAKTLKTGHSEGERERESYREHLHF